MFVFPYSICKLETCMQDTLCSILAYSVHTRENTGQQKEGCYIKIMSWLCKVCMNKLALSYSKLFLYTSCDTILIFTSISISWIALVGKCAYNQLILTGLMAYSVS